jgi:small GTP-binding protein
MSSFKLKVLLIGAPGVNKISLVKSIIKNRFAANYRLTVGIDILTKDVEFEQGEIATLSIWDIGTQKRFEFIRSTLYKGAGGALLVFDLVREQTYNFMKDQLIEIKQYTGENIPFVLIGNTANLTENHKAAIDRDEVLRFCLDAGGIYVEGSPKNYSNIEVALAELTRRIIEARNSPKVL